MAGTLPNTDQVQMKSIKRETVFWRLRHAAGGKVLVENIFFSYSALADFRLRYLKLLYSFFLSIKISAIHLMMMIMMIKSTAQINNAVQTVKRQLNVRAIER